MPTLAQLKQTASDLGLPTSGTKAVLEARIALARGGNNANGYNGSPLEWVHVLQNPMIRDIKYKNKRYSKVGEGNVEMIDDDTRVYSVFLKSDERGSSSEILAVVVTMHRFGNTPNIIVRKMV